MRRLVCFLIQWNKSSRKSYFDDIVIDGLYNTLMQSSDFFSENTEESLKPAPVFQAQMILNATEIQFKSSLNKKTGDGFYDLR